MHEDVDGDYILLTYALAFETVVETAVTNWYQCPFSTPVFNTNTHEMQNQMHHMQDAIAMPSSDP